MKNIRNMKKGKNRKNEKLFCSEDLEYKNKMLILPQNHSANSQICFYFVFFRLHVAVHFYKKLIKRKLNQ